MFCIIIFIYLYANFMMLIKQWMGPSNDHCYWPGHFALLLDLAHLSRAEQNRQVRWSKLVSLTNHA